MDRYRYGSGSIWIFVEQIFKHIQDNLCDNIYIYIYIYVCVFVYVCVYSCNILPLNPYSSDTHPCLSHSYGFSVASNHIFIPCPSFASIPWGSIWIFAIPTGMRNSSVGSSMIAGCSRLSMKGIQLPENDTCPWLAERQKIDQVNYHTNNLNHEPLDPLYSF